MKARIVIEVDGNLETIEFYAMTTSDAVGLAAELICRKCQGEKKNLQCSIMVENERKEKIENGKVAEKNN